MRRAWLVVGRQQTSLSFRLDRRVPVWLLGLAGAALVASVLSVGVGEYPISSLDVIRAVLGLETGNPDHSFIVRTLRLPRVLVALGIGAALAVSGVIMQGLTRNPLASPELTGVTAGASLAAVVLLVATPAASVVALPWAALLGAVIAAGLVYLLSWRGDDSPLRLILVGIGLTSIIGALTTVMVTFGEIDDVARALVWLTGSVYGTSWEGLRALVPWMAVFLPAALILARHLDVLHLGEDVARGLGSRVELQRGLLLLTAAALVAATVTVAGTVGFVGLIAPHIARRLVGPSHEGVLPTAALTGSLIVVLADLLGRTLFAPVEIPCGVVTAVIGAPFFMYLLYRNRNN
ncbi:MAG: iron ABC transporter permease [Chloroflexota bacterium]|nr:iron ABC transporter permease [Chloroflexota bacterium]